jgi:hypothetical protein
VSIDFFTVPTVTMRVLFVVFVYRAEPPIESELPTRGWTKVEVSFRV